jgi:hypothetical protein
VGEGRRSGPGREGHLDAGAAARPHDLRRTLAGTLDARRVPLQAIRVVLRHDTIAATPAYLADNSLRRTTTAPCVLDLPQRGLVVTAKSLVRWRFGELETFDVERGVGTRLIVRRERPHPGAQLSLFDTIEGLRHTAFITDTPSRDIAGLELRHRQRARAEQVVRDAKACGLSRLPFDAAADNDAWMHLAFTACDLLAWARRITLHGPLRRATPKTLRHRLLHVAAQA